MQAKKLAGIVPLTRESLMWSVVDLDAYVRQDLRSQIALITDLNAWLGTGAGASPLGILNKAGVTVIVPTFASPTAPTIVEIDRMATQFILAMTNVYLAQNARWRWVMSPRTAAYISNLRVGGTNGDLAYPGMQGLAKTFKDIPIIVTTQLPTTGGAGTDATLIALVDFTHVLYGEEEGIVMRYSEEATLDPDGSGTALIHLFQMNQVAILAETMHDFGLRYVKAVVRANAIRF
jgi:HK97 family phage major capsid protein